MTFQKPEHFLRDDDDLVMELYCEECSALFAGDAQFDLAEQHQVSPLIKPVYCPNDMALVFGADPVHEISQPTPGYTPTKRRKQ